MHEPFVTELCALVAKHRHVFGEIRKVEITQPIVVTVHLQANEHDSFFALSEKHKGLPDTQGGPIALMVEYEEEQSD